MRLSTFSALRCDLEHWCPYPPPHMVDDMICGESYILWVPRTSSLDHSVAVTGPCDTLVLTASSSSSSANSSPFFFLPWKRVSWTFLRSHYANFLTRSPGFQELFSNSPLSTFGHLSWGPASRLAIMRTIWSEWTRAWWPPLSYHSFESFGHLSPVTYIFLWAYMHMYSAIQLISVFLSLSVNSFNPNVCFSQLLV